MLLLLLACHRAKDSGAPVETDTDLDTDTDSDTDADADADADTDTDSDTDVTLSFTELDGVVLNPERGFLASADLVPASDLEGLRDEGLTLAYTGVRLDDFRDSELDLAFLADLEDGFAAARAAGVKVVLRFVYNDGGGGDAEESVILGHLEQLAPVLADNDDVIAVMQAGFIGQWGEWHDSTHGLDNATSRGHILAAVLDALPTTRMTQVRTPMFKDDAFGGPLDEGDAYSGSDPARVGHHNDCFLASEDDEGTYDRPIDDWKGFVAAEGRFTPVGGETCAVNPPRSECATALEELEALHWSFMNLQWHPDVVEGWRAEGCLDEIDRRLGYRFVLRTMTYPEVVSAGAAFTVALELDNVGYAAMFNERPVWVVVDDGKGTRWEQRVATADPRAWEPGEPITLSAELTAPSAAGVYRISLWMPDASAALLDRADYAVRLANDDLWEPSSGLNVLAPLTVE